MIKECHKCPSMLQEKCARELPERHKFLCEPYIPPPTPLENYQTTSQRLYQLAHLKKYGKVDEKEFIKAFGDAFISLNDLMTENRLSFKDIFMGEDSHE